MRNIILAFLLCAAAASASPTVPRRDFVHPGMLHSKADLDRMRLMVSQGNEPWKGGWNKLLAAHVSKLDYKDHAVENLSVASGGAAGTGQQDDASASHFHAIQWYVTGSEAHAKKSLEILNAWSYKLKTMEGTNAPLQTGISGYHFCNAAEILKHTWTGFPAADIAQFEKMILTIFYPVIQGWKPTHNGNWDAYMILTMMSIGIFSDSAALFDKAVDWYLNGESQGSLKGYIYESGQCQESTRDQMHVQMGLGAMAGACETGWHQGVDMWGAHDYRFLKGLEYSAKYNLGYSVPAVGTISASGRGQIRPMWEISYNHYANRKGLPVPYLKELTEKKRPEGYEQDYISLGTLLFYTDSKVPGGGTTGIGMTRMPIVRVEKGRIGFSRWSALKVLRGDLGNLRLQDLLGRASPMPPSSAVLHLPNRGK